LVATKPLDQTVAKWKRKVAGASEDYRAGVENPREDWASATKAAETRYKEGVTRAAAEGRFGRGVSKAGTEKWKRGAVEKGVSRWPDGVSAAEGDYSAGMSEVLSTIQSVTLPPRGAAGDPRNYERTKAIGTALHTKFKGR
jgi:hypothetical protein